MEAESEIILPLARVPLGFSGRPQGATEHFRLLYPAVLIKGRHNVPCKFQGRKTNQKTKTFGTLNTISKVCTFSAYN